ncbi:membrane bound O-acyl transferase family-domain-containing protein [Mycena galericulata]|nr:membrane bound O-acyl transferase family-domain-containing protein [Mycena galericulata]KAJ7455986.1 membrane bound O-acyl transferase family-domain-containing protein [Mycena galericulata]
MPIQSWRLGSFPIGLFTVYTAVIVISLALRPSPYRRLLFLPLLVLTWGFLTQHGSGYLSSAFWFMWLLNASDYILLTDVQRELKKLPTPNQAVATGGFEDIENTSLLRRLQWGLHLFLSPRGVGWTHALKHFLPPSGKRTSDAEFIRRRLWILVRSVLLLDVLNLYVRWNPAYRTSLRTVGWLELYAVSAVCPLTAYVILEIPHCVLSLTAVTLGLSAPHDWPPLFGRVGEASNVRNFWGKCWHQIFRRPLTAHIRFISRLMPLPPQSDITMAVETCAAFLLSGIVHYFGETVVLGRHFRSGSLVFFGIQPVAFALENLVASLAHRSGVIHHRIATILGYVWTATWFAWVVPFMQDPLIAAGETLSRYIKVSLVMGVWRGTWVLPPVEGSH